MSESLDSSILMDHLILQKILKNLDLEDMKATRLVCKTWNSEVVEYISNSNRKVLTLISMDTLFKDADSELEEGEESWTKHLEDETKSVEIFLLGWKIHHILQISLLEEHPPEFEVDTDILRLYWSRSGESQTERSLEYLVQENNFLFAEHVVENFLERIISVVKEVRLELCLNDEQDFYFFEKIVDILEGNFTNVSITLVLFPDNLPLPDATRSHDHSVVTTCRIRILGGIFIEDLTFGEEIPQYFPAVTTCLKTLFPKAEIVDEGQRRQVGLRDECSNFVILKNPLSHLLT